MLVSMIRIQLHIKSYTYINYVSLISGDDIVKYCRLIEVSELGQVIHSFKNVWICRLQLLKASFNDLQVLTLVQVEDRNWQ